MAPEAAQLNPCASSSRRVASSTAPSAGQQPGTHLKCFFREERLSDLIGFTYSTWHGDDAANNLVHDLVEMARGRNTAGPTHAVLVALDGENAWEYYPFNGYWFLKAMYANLAANPHLELMTMSECLARGVQPVTVDRLPAGSWVHGTLATWMGDAPKNLGWDLLCEAKQAYDAVLAGGALDAAAAAAATRQLALCESSDWFWWFGDYNPQLAVSQFDQLYRRQLQTLYRLLGRAVPEALSRPIATGSGDMENGGVMRRA